MFIKWTLFFIILSMLCHASLSLKKLDFLQTLSSSKSFVADPFSIYFQNRLKRPNKLDFNILHFKEIKAFIQKIKLSKQVFYLNIEYSPNPTRTSKLNFLISDSWALGPKGGVLTSYPLADSFELIGKTARNFVLTKIELTENDPFNIKELFFKQSTTDFGFGIGYASCIAKLRLTLKAFYDFHVLSDLETLVQIAQLTNKNTILFEDFYFHGLSGILRFDF